MNIACWSGPRNLSTAMMYAFGNRRDCAVVDEPFYAAYLAETGLDHPMSEEVMASQDTDPAKIASLCTSPPSNGAPYFYQKHMTLHMLPDFDRSWFDQVRHVFLIRHPARVLASYGRKRENPTLDDIGFSQQTALFEEIVALGLAPLVIDSSDIRQAPKAMLRALCTALDMPFDADMLSWPKGGHPDDGVWAPHWYDAVHRSTGFAGAEGPLPETQEPLTHVLEAALPHYEALKARAIKL